MPLSLQGGPEKISHYQIIQQLYLIALKPANEIRFLCQIKVSIKYHNIICWY